MDDWKHAGGPPVPVIYAALNVAVVCTGLFWVAEPTGRQVTLLSMPFALIAVNLAAWVGFRYRKRLAATDGDGGKGDRRILVQRGLDGARKWKRG
jgi:hypothetical protein